MVQHYSTGKNIYSVDMMMAYVNQFKPKPVKLKVSDLSNNLEYECWGNGSTIRYSPLDVIKKPKKYKDESRRIKKADLSYPIMIYGKFVIDGVHRLTKAYMKEIPTIKAYKFDSKLMKKFLINKDGDYKKVLQYDMEVYVRLFHKRFCNNNIL